MHTGPTIESVITYDGSPNSVYRIMKELSRMTGVNNSEFGLYMDGILYPIGSNFKVTKNVTLEHISKDTPCETP